MEAPQHLLIDLPLLNEISNNEMTVEIQKEGDKYQWKVRSTFGGYLLNNSEWYKGYKLMEKITDINSDLNHLGVKFINVDNMEGKEMIKLDLNGMESGERKFGNKKVVHKVNDNSKYTISITGNVYIFYYSRY